MRSLGVLLFLSCIVQFHVEAKPSSLLQKNNVSGSETTQNVTVLDSPLSSFSVATVNKSTGSYWMWQRPLDELIEECLEKTDLSFPWAVGSRIRLTSVDNIFIQNMSSAEKRPAGLNDMLPQVIHFRYTRDGQPTRITARCVIEVVESEGDLKVQEFKLGGVPASLALPSPLFLSFAPAYDYLKNAVHPLSIVAVDVEERNGRPVYNFGLFRETAQSPSGILEDWLVDMITHDVTQLIDAA